VGKTRGKAGPRAESAARKAVTDLVERERRIKKRKDAADARTAAYAKWLNSCERLERVMDRKRARHWLAYGQKWKRGGSGRHAGARLSPTQGVST
jgi:hypothetical protein